MRIIAGPCLHESKEQSLKIARRCYSICKKYGIDYYFKASFDKANRTLLDSPRGNTERTVSDFVAMKRLEPWLKIVTDVHETWQIDYVKNAVDVIQIPAFLSRQTDLIVEAAATGKIVNIKKGQFMAPWDIHAAYDKAKEAKKVWITDRGTSFGYDNLVVDFIGMTYLVDHYLDNFIFDATHAVQKCPEKLLKSDYMLREVKPSYYVPSLVVAAAAMGVQSFFMEVHEYPDNAPSDGPNSINLDTFESLVKEIYKHV